MSHKIIRSIYEARLADWASTRQPALRIAYQNLQFTAAAGEPYLRAFSLAAGTDSDTLRGRHRSLTGLFQVSIVTPADSGSGVGEGLIDELGALFPLFERLTKHGITVTTMSPVQQGPSMQDDTHYMIPASWRYRCDTG